MEYFEKLTLKQKLGLIIKANRKDRGFTQDDLANKINCDQSVISRIEIGHESVDLTHFSIALQTLGMKYVGLNLSPLNLLMDEIWYSYSYENKESLLKLEKVLTQLIAKNQDILYETHYGVLMFFFYYYKGELDKSLEVYDYLKDIIYVCEKRFQMLYLLTYLNIMILRNNLNEAEVTVDELKKQKTIELSPILDFYIGNYYFRKNNRSIALKYYLEALNFFEQNKNYVRVFYVELFISSLLIQENNFMLALEKLNRLKKYIPYLTEALIHVLYFWIGYCFYKKKDLNEAIYYFNESLRYVGQNDVNHIYYYLLKIYDELDDLNNYKQILSQIDYKNNHKYGTIIINLEFQRKMHSHKKYYEYIESEIVPIMHLYYEKVEISAYLLELLDYYYDNQQYTKYHDLAKIIYKNFA